jgi:hypothetical protein
VSPAPAFTRLLRLVSFPCPRLPPDSSCTLDCVSNGSCDVNQGELDKAHSTPRAHYKRRSIRPGYREQHTPTSSISWTTRTRVITYSARSVPGPEQTKKGQEERTSTHQASLPDGSHQWFSPFGHGVFQMKLSCSLGVQPRNEFLNLKL